MDPLGHRWIRRAFMTTMILLGGVNASAFGQDDRALSLLEEAGDRYRQIRGFCASFEQALEVPLLGETTYSKGTLCEGRPNLFSMRFTDPQGDMLVADGEFFWVYYPSSDPRQVLQFGLEVRPGGVDFHREFLEAPAEKYEMVYIGEEAHAGAVTQVISVKPRTPSGFEEARLWLDPARALIVQARIGMENGSVRTVSLSDIQLDPPPDPERFRFVPPEGARVIRR